MAVYWSAGLSGSAQAPFWNQAGHRRADSALPPADRGKDAQSLAHVPEQAADLRLKNALESSKKTTQGRRWPETMRDEYPGTLSPLSYPSPYIFQIQYRLSIKTHVS